MYQEFTSRNLGYIAKDLQEHIGSTTILKNKSGHNKSGHHKFCFEPFLFKSYFHKSKVEMQGEKLCYNWDINYFIQSNAQIVQLKDSCFRMSNEKNLRHVS